MPDLPRFLLPGAPAGFSIGATLETLPWHLLPALPLVLAEDGGVPVQPTELRLAASAERLWVRFDCRDDEPWSTFTQRDEPLWQEEVVEVFLAAGERVPRRYVELEINPGGALFDAWVDNPTGDRARMTVDTGWDCPGLAWEAGEVRDGWWAALSIPWRSVLGGPTVEVPRLWRANFYRIDRPSGAPPEHSAWSPTLADPADFHRPGRFGVLELAVHPLPPTY